ncbi:MAG TPA: hypothetical protein VL461_07230 [Dictyobacter sp.]|jgi:hypothetical protein|nr:hypothetical protein [Dictyobacter sp.]
MGERWDQDPNSKGQPNFDDIDKRLEDIGRKLVQGANEAQLRLKRAVNKANDYWVQTQNAPTPHQSSNIEEQRLRQLVNDWSNQNWRVARDLGTYMDIVSWRSDEVWEIALETRWETRSMEVVSEPYIGQSMGKPQPLLPVWDYELPEVTGLKAPSTRTRLDGINEIVGCTVCNGNGHVFCSGCNGRGWIVCPDCKGRTKKRCDTCKGRGYVADWTPNGQKKPFFRRQAENVASSFGNKVSDVFDSIRQQGVPIPNPVDTDPASKGPTVPCPDCVHGEVDCTCGNGKRVCPTCQGAKMSLCSNCAGTGKMVRHREIARRFDLRSQTRFVGETPIPVQQLLKANGDLVYSSEINETMHVDAPPDMVPSDVWHTTVELVETERKSPAKPGMDPQSWARPTLQVVELVRVPYISLQYRMNDQDYLLFIYDGEGNEKFYADQFPVRWDRVERLFKAISTDLMTPAQSEQSTDANRGYSGYRVPIEYPSYNITEENDINHPADHPDDEQK